MRKLEARCNFLGILKPDVFYEIMSIDYEKDEICVYTQGDKSDFVLLKGMNIVEIRVKKDGLFD